jgi:ferric-dicitrate binding protein FerR (iron transport regulator)
MKIQKEITTAKLLKYFKGELDQQEARAIESWASESEENEKTLMSLAKVYNLGQLARTYTEKEVEDAWKKTCARFGVAPRARNPLKRQWVFWSMAVAIALLVAVNLALVLNAPVAGTDKAIILTSQQGKFVKYTLPDSTVVTLNHNSSLEFPLAFNGDERRVKLNGEGYFDVARDEEKPFIVETGKEIQIKVLGTEFNLQSFSSDDIVQVSLISGLVEISRNGVADFSYIMHPSERFTCNVSNWEMKVETLKGITGVEWMSNKLVFMDTTLKEVARQISNHFGVQVIIEEEGLNSIRFSGSFDNRDLGTVLSYMEQTCGIKTMITPDGITLKRK